MYHSSISIDERREICHARYPRAATKAAAPATTAAEARSGLSPARRRPTAAAADLSQVHSTYGPFRRIHVVPIVAGIRLDRTETLQLAAMLTRAGSDHTSRLLLDAVTCGQDFVALTRDDREEMLAVLDHPPNELVPLRTALFTELNWLRGLSGGTPPRHRSPYVRLESG
jgi:hypothetical protein